jgi:hypothetical protein
MPFPSSFTITIKGMHTAYKREDLARAVLELLVGISSLSIIETTFCRTLVKITSSGKPPSEQSKHLYDGL